MQARAIGKNSQPHSNAEIRLLFDGIAARIATISQLHRMLASLPTDGAVHLNSHLADVCANLITAFSSEQHPVSITHHGGSCHVLTRHVQPITLIVCEILINSLKYAHPAGAPLRMVVSCETRANDTLMVSVSDDGVGLPEGFDPMKDGGIGFQVVRALASEIGATLNVHSDNLGVTFKIMVPDSLVANARTA
jgi:two-component sensor histidine kinase